MNKRTRGDAIEKLEGLPHESFPSLYKNASLTSKNAQQSFFLGLGFSLVSLLMATILSIINLPLAGYALAQTAILLASVGLTIFLSWVQPQRTWYAARALSESIKTITWRYVMRAEPYNGKYEVATTHLVANIRKILQDNRVLTKILAATDGDEISARMTEIRKLPLATRRELYEKFRVNDQLNWYRSKARSNAGSSTLWYSFLIIIQVIAIVFALARIWYPFTEIWPTDFFVAAASCAMTWLQTKRFQELAASYSLTAHDIGLLKAQLNDAKTESKFSAFVGDAENAFSREHTQWRARRDVE